MTSPSEAQLYQGYLGELVRDPGPSPITVWMLAWRCKRCGHCWPLRKTKRTHNAAHLGEHVNPGRELPRKCPACDSPLWWRDYLNPEHARVKHGRKPVRLRQWRDRFGNTERRGEDEP